MNPSYKSNEQHFYPEGYTEKFFMKFQTTPSRPDMVEGEAHEVNSVQEVENFSRNKTWTKTTDAWV
ncbi:MAG: hypothetical protein LWX83_01240 [Anaerolineae bacterium]|nr:hypothetical protein [Anaerolineae bacterium]